MERQFYKIKNQPVSQNICIDNNHLHYEKDVTILYNASKGILLKNLKIISIKKSAQEKDNITPS